MEPLCHIWLPSGHVLFGCKRGEIVKVGWILPDILKFDWLTFPILIGRCRNSWSWGLSQHWTRFYNTTNWSISFRDYCSSNNASIPGDDVVLDCAITVILFHKNGVYVATDIGQILCFDMSTKSTSPKLISHLNIDHTSICSGNFSLYYDQIVMRTKTVLRVLPLHSKSIYKNDYNFCV